MWVKSVKAHNHAKNRIEEFLGVKGHNNEVQPGEMHAWSETR